MGSSGHRVTRDRVDRTRLLREMRFLRRMLEWALDNVTKEARTTERYKTARAVQEGRNPNISDKGIMGEW